MRPHLHGERLRGDGTVAHHDIRLPGLAGEPGDDQLVRGAELRSQRDSAECRLRAVDKALPIDSEGEDANRNRIDAGP